MRAIHYGLTLATVAALTLAGCDRGEPERPAAPPATAQAPATGTVLTLAQRDANFTTWTSALQTAGMVDTLNRDGPYTVFAPTNAAFEKVPAERREALTRPEGLAELRRLLSYHIVPGRLNTASLVQRIQAGGGALALTTLQGGALTARINPGGTIELTDAAGGVSRVVEADAAASNGIIHAIDTVATPG